MNVKPIIEALNRISSAIHNHTIVVKRSIDLQEMHGQEARAAQEEEREIRAKIAKATEGVGGSLVKPSEGEAVIKVLCDAIKRGLHPTRTGSIAEAPMNLSAYLALKKDGFFEKNPDIHARFVDRSKPPHDGHSFWMLTLTEEAYQKRKEAGKQL